MKRYWYYILHVFFWGAAQFIMFTEKSDVAVENKHSWSCRVVEGSVLDSTQAVACFVNICPSVPEGDQNLPWLTSGILWVPVVPPRAASHPLPSGDQRGWSFEPGDNLLLWIVIMLLRMIMWMRAGCVVLIWLWVLACVYLLQKTEKKKNRQTIAEWTSELVHMD